MKHPRCLRTGMALLHRHADGGDPGDRQMTGDLMDDRVRDPDAQAHFVLFVAGQSPRSKRARDSVHRIFEARGLDRRQVEIVDALTESSRVLTHQIVAVPALMKTGGSSDSCLYVDQPEEERLGRWLDEVLGTGVDAVTS